MRSAEPPREFNEFTTIFRRQFQTITAIAQAEIRPLHVTICGFTERHDPPSTCMALQNVQSFCLFWHHNRRIFRRMQKQIAFFLRHAAQIMEEFQMRRTNVADDASRRFDHRRQTVNFALLVASHLNDRRLRFIVDTE